MCMHVLFFIFVFILVTGERIAVDYLLAQTNRGDRLAPKQKPEIPSQVLEEDDDEPYATVCMPDDLGAGDPWNEADPDATLSQSAELSVGGDPDPPSAAEDQVLLEGDTKPGPLVIEVHNTFPNTLLKNTIFKLSKSGYILLR